MQNIHLYKVIINEKCNNEKMLKFKRVRLLFLYLKEVLVGIVLSAILALVVMTMGMIYIEFVLLFGYYVVLVIADKYPQYFLIYFDYDSVNIFGLLMLRFLGCSVFICSFIVIIFLQLRCWSKKQQYYTIIFYFLIWFHFTILIFKQLYLSMDDVFLYVGFVKDSPVLIGLSAVEFINLMYIFVLIYIVLFIIVVIFHCFFKIYVSIFIENGYFSVIVLSVIIFYLYFYPYFQVLGTMSYSILIGGLLYIYVLYVTDALDFVVDDKKLGIIIKNDIAILFCNCYPSYSCVISDNSVISDNLIFSDNKIISDSMLQAYIRLVTHEKLYGMCNKNNINLLDKEL